MGKLILASVFLAVIILGSGISIYLIEPSIHYSLSTYQYQKLGKQWFSILDFNNASNISQGMFVIAHTQNSGYFDGTFTITIKLFNASFSGETPLSAKLIGDNLMTFSSILHPQEKKDLLFFFTLDSNISEFAVSIDFQNNQLFLRSVEDNWGGQSFFQYSEHNNVWIPSLKL